MRNERFTKDTLKREQVESLMLMSVLAQEPYRSQARQELRRRRIVRTQDRLADAFMLLL
jgi:hypothetical protein